MDGQLARILFEIKNPMLLITSSMKLTVISEEQILQLSTTTGTVISPNILTTLKMLMEML